MSKPIVNLNQVSFAYPGKSILDGVDLKVEAGQLISIVGKSGNGKSTLLYVLGGFLKPASGAYEFDGRTVYTVGEFGLGRFRKNNIGFVFQDFRLLPFLPVEQNIKFPLYFSGRRVKAEDTRDLIEKLGIYHRRKAFPRDISGGEAQRTAIGRALVMGPRLLLLDEPTGNLDVRTEAEIVETLVEFKNKGLALVCVTHSERIMAASNAVWELEDGKLTALEKTAPAKKTKKVKKAKKSKSKR